MKRVRRIAALLLVPCLLTDSGVAAYRVPTCRFIGRSAVMSVRFGDNAIPAGAFLYPRFPFSWAKTYLLLRTIGHPPAEDPIVGGHLPAMFKDRKLSTTLSKRLQKISDAHRASKKKHLLLGREKNSHRREREYSAIISGGNSLSTTATCWIRTMFISY
jgi:hypothetical protein